jgi:SET domain-containing protein
VTESKIVGGGRGVFATKDLKKGELIEVCPTIVVGSNDLEKVNQTGLVEYSFYFGERLGKAMIALGYGSIYNHSYEPNAKYEIDEVSKIMLFRAVKDIEKGDEVLINYNPEARGELPLWFE